MASAAVVHREGVGVSRTTHARARDSSGGPTRDVRERLRRAGARVVSPDVEEVSRDRVPISRTLTTSAVRAAVALRAATGATGATTRRAETVAAIVAGYGCDANVRCEVPRGGSRETRYFADSLIQQRGCVAVRKNIQTKYPYEKRVSIIRRGIRQLSSIFFTGDVFFRQRRASIP